MNPNIKISLKTIVIAAFLALFATSTTNAQDREGYTPLPQGFLKKIPSTVKWIDNQTFILQTSNGLATETIKDSKREKYTEPETVLGAKLTESELQKYIPDWKNVQNPMWSPDRKKFAFTRDNDLFTYNLKTQKETRLTSDGTNVIMNGYGSWVYNEEIFGRRINYRAFWWSPDSNNLVFFHFDDTNVPIFPIYFAEGSHGFLENWTYPKAGDENPKVKVGIVPADGSKPTVWARFNENDDQYIGTPIFSPDGSKLYLQWMNRNQNLLILYEIDQNNGDKKSVYSEEQETWITWIDQYRFVNGGMLLVRDFSGYDQIYYTTLNNENVVAITNGENVGIKLLEADEQTHKVYFMSRTRRSTDYDLYCSSFPKTGDKAKTSTPTLLTKEPYNYSNVVLSPDRKYFTAIYQTVNMPPCIGLFQSGKGLVREIASSKGENFNNIQIPETELVWIEVGEGFKVPAVIVWPLNMDKSKKYPVICDIYGGPNNGTVMDSWALFKVPTMYWAKQGVIQINMDHRASGHCGKIGQNYVHRNLGYWEIHDYKLWIDYLRKFSYVNADKVGITGYSYGGYITSLAVTTAGDYFQYGISGAGVHDWRLYDSHYTERYMDRPQDNKEGYDKSSVILNCGSYRTFGKDNMLLITHGTSDDNVHYQNSMQLVEELMRTNKRFEFMMYPTERHGYRGYKSIYSNSEDIEFWKKHLLDK